jgi:hypothetical protein
MWDAEGSGASPIDEDAPPIYSRLRERPLPIVGELAAHRPGERTKCNITFISPP